MNKEYQKIIFDIEADNLLDSVTKIHCLSYCNTKEGIVNSITNYEDIKNFFLQEKTIFVGHNIQLYDIPVVEKILNIKVNAPQIDTLALSWILFPNRDKHSLESFEDEVGVKKVQIADWSNLTTEDYKKRCENDVLINLGVWKKQAKLLTSLYDNNHEEIYRYLEYISFKMDCVKEHQELGVKLDIELVKSSLQELEKIKEDKINTLKQAMPKRPIKSVKFPPKVMYKKDGSPSENRLKWLEFLKNNNLPETHNTEVEYISDYEEPNPNSHSQLKDWLFNLGWQPEHYKYVREDGKSEMRKIPQIKSKDDNDGSVCPSILKLVEKEPVLENLNGLFILNHRLGIFKGFLDNEKNGKLYQGIHGFTSTLRLKHAVLVNLPSISKLYAENIRKCLMAKEGNCLIGTDLKSIENKLKDHFIYPLDSEYVKKTNSSDYDPHLEICKIAGFLTENEVEEHKLYDKTKGKEGKSHKLVRQRGKTTNYAAQYGVSSATLSRNIGISEKEAKKLLNAYWEMNWAAKKIAETTIVKVINGQKWQYNPISKFWYELRAEKDRLSALVQSSSAYVFDLFLKYMKENNLAILAQFHDEAIIETLDTEEAKKEVKEKIQKSIEKVNETLKLNVLVEHSLDFGYRYSDIH